MEGQQPRFLPYDGSHPPYDPPRKSRGCLFYGCITMVVLGVIVAILVGLGLFSLYRLFGNFVRDYAEDAPRPVPVATLPEDQLEALKARVSRFQKALEDGTPAEPLVLTADEINAMIDANPAFKGVIAVDLANDKVGGQVSFPLSRLGLGFGDKFLNGAATFDVRIDRGLLLVTVDSLEVKGKPLPEAALAELRMKNLAQDYAEDPKNARQNAAIERIEVKDGKLILTPKLLAPADPAKPAEPTPPKDAEPKPAPPAESEKAAPK